MSVSTLNTLRPKYCSFMLTLNKTVGYKHTTPVSHTDLTVCLITNAQNRWYIRRISLSLFLSHTTAHFYFTVIMATQCSQLYRQCYVQYRNFRRVMLKNFLLYYRHTLDLFCRRAVQVKLRYELNITSKYVLRFLQIFHITNTTNLTITRPLLLLLTKHEKQTQQDCRNVH